MCYSRDKGAPGAMNNTILGTSGPLCSQGKNPFGEKPNLKPAGQAKTSTSTCVCTWQVESVHMLGSSYGISAECCLVGDLERGQWADIRPVRLASPASQLLDRLVGDSGFGC